MTRLESDYYAFMGYDPAHARSGLAHYVPLFPRGPVLELACGRGEFLELLREARERVLATAPSQHSPARWTA